MFKCLRLNILRTLKVLKPFENLKMLKHVSGCPFRIFRILAVVNGLEKPRCLPQTMQIFTNP